MGDTIKFPSRPLPQPSGLTRAVRTAGQGHATKARFERWAHLLGETMSEQEELLRWAGIGVEP
jgi:hypothetical protein